MLGCIHSHPGPHAACRPRVGHCWFPKHQVRFLILTQYCLHVPCWPSHFTARRYLRSFQVKEMWLLMRGYLLLIVLLSMYFFSLFYWCSNTVVSILPPPLSLTLPTPTSHPQSHLPLGSVHGSLIHVHLRPFPFFPTLFPSPLPSGYCQFIVECNVSAIFFLPVVLLIRFHLKVRSYGICPSPPGLLHLA